MSSTVPHWYHIELLEKENTVRPSFWELALEINLRVYIYISALVNETAFIVGKKNVTFRHYNFMSSSD